jgi:putative FmdB family regulatory protein
MPIYDYVCTSCDHRTDILHGINDPGPKYCPSCGLEGTMRKQFAPPVIHYKGSGWAKKDRGGSSSTRASSSAAGAGSGESKPSSTADGGSSSSDSSSSSGTTGAESKG